jgi:hypothetical protein
VRAAAPDLAERVQARFDDHIHKVMATLRADGSPRVSGTELSFRDGEVWLGSMLDAVKARDLLRDPRIAVHGAPSDAEMRGGDAKLAGRAVEVTDPEKRALFAPSTEDEPPAYHLFRIDVHEIVLTRVDQERELLIVESWSPTRGVHRVERQ